MKPELAVIATPRNEAVCDILRDALAMAEAGEISECLIVLKERGSGDVLDRASFERGIEMLGALELAKDAALRAMARASGR